MPNTESDLVEQLQLLRLLGAFFKLRNSASRRKVIEKADALTKAEAATELKDIR
jgi:hypothetical protein